MLEKIKFKGFETSASEFKELEDAEGGKYKVTFEGYKFTSDKDEDEEFSWIEVIAEPNITGYSKDDTENTTPVFNVDLTITLFFDVQSEDIVSYDFFKKNIWFFENFVAISTKLAVESTLLHTPLSTIKLPWSIPT
ncbi:Uncharacterised protein [Serratia fonticola]|uniref:hypothetical protein n=1 Tax=Serratia fonticola TaxID=47917 RepID=UPI00217C8191|nr:hypothetical protein [Serratia fonticola]CAI1599013.1 Uncharacterised protein [Serratia fonticola]